MRPDISSYQDWVKYKVIPELELNNNGDPVSSSYTFLFYSSHTSILIVGNIVGMTIGTFYVI